MRLYEERPGRTMDRARHLRRNASTPERRLLSALREAFPVRKWCHQAPLGPYYADILCFSERLVIEVDGDTHMAMSDYDAARTAFMAREDFRVIRFANTDVMQNINGVLTKLPFSLRKKEEAAQPRTDEGDRAKKKGGTA